MAKQEGSPKDGDIFGAVFDDTLFGDPRSQQNIIQATRSVKGHLFYSILVGRRVFVSDSWLVSNPAFTELWHCADGGSLADLVREGHVVVAIRDNSTIEEAQDGLYQQRAIPHSNDERYRSFVREVSASMQERHVWRYGLKSLTTGFDTASRASLEEAVWASGPGASKGKLLNELFIRARELAEHDPVRDREGKALLRPDGSSMLGARHIQLFEEKNNPKDHERFQPVKDIVLTAVRRSYQQALVVRSNGTLTNLCDRAFSLCGEPSLELFWSKVASAHRMPNSPEPTEVGVHMPTLFADPRSAATGLANFSFDDFRRVLNDKSVRKLRSKGLYAARLSECDPSAELLSEAGDYSIAVAEAMKIAIRDSQHDRLQKQIRGKGRAEVALKRAIKGVGRLASYGLIAHTVSIKAAIVAGAFVEAIETIGAAKEKERTDQLKREAAELSKQATSVDAEAAKEVECRLRSIVTER